jgi:diguanylate cyclase (GGDEF)-like protein
VLDRDFLSYRVDDAYLNLRSSSISRGNSHFPVDGFPRSMKIVYSYEHGAENLRDRPVKALLPDFEENDVSWDYLFLPIHFRQYTVGYFAIQDAIRLLSSPHLPRTIRVLDVVIENFYTNNILRKYNRILSDVSTKDAMTGFYNRLGYERFACRTFDERKKAGQDMSILFIDMDGLKKMNDNYGHECGDYAIKAIAAAIHRHCGSDTLKIRMGGDEFLVMLDRISDEQVDKLLQQIESEIPNTKEVSHLPYSPGISVGYIHTDAAKDMELDDYVREADAFMYEKKKLKGVARK